MVNETVFYKKLFNASYIEFIDIEFLDINFLDLRFA